MTITQVSRATQDDVQTTTDRALCPACWHSIRVVGGHLAAHAAPSQPFTPLRDCPASGWAVDAEERPASP